jgi:hypothetical protein
MSLVNNPSCLNAKLFDVHDVGICYRNPWFTPLRIVDNKIIGVALKIIQKSSFILAAGLCAAIVVGVSSIPVVGLAGLLGIGLVCCAVRSQCKQYYNKVSLKQHQDEALTLVKGYTYLENIELEGPKQKFLRPITHLIEKHHDVDSIIKYRILSPADFKKAFDLEMKQLNPLEQVVLYSRVKAAAEKSSDYALVMNTPDAYIQILKNYITENPGMTSADNVMNYDTMNTKAVAVKDFFSMADLLMKDPQVISLDQSRIINRCKVEYQRAAKVFNKKNDKVRALEKKIMQLEVEKEKSYQQHGSHHVISNEQKQFLHHIEDVQKDYEQKLNELNRMHHIQCKAIEGRRHLNFPEDQALFQEAQLRYDNDKMIIQQACKEGLKNCVTMSMQTDFLMSRDQLQAYRIAVDNEYRPKIAALSHQLDDLKYDIDVASMQKFQDCLIRCSKELSNLYSQAST